MLAKPWRRLFPAAFGLNLVVVAVLRDSVGTSYIVAVLQTLQTYTDQFQLMGKKANGCLDLQGLGTLILMKGPYLNAIRNPCSLNAPL